MNINRVSVFHFYNKAAMNNLAHFAYFSVGQTLDSRYTEALISLAEWLH
jgi:hypothetical protein